MRRAGVILGLALSGALIALGWATLPSASSPSVTLRSHARLLLHLLGALPPLRDVKHGQGSLAARRPSNGSIAEVQGFVSAEAFRAKYLWKGPIVFRAGATPDFGFDLGCLTRRGRSAQEGLVEELGERAIRVFRDQYDDTSAEDMTILEYDRLAKEVLASGSQRMPYPRAFPQSSMRTCAPVPSKLMRQYRSWAGWAAQAFLPEPDTSVVFASLTEGTNTKMHMDIGDSFFTQVHGRKRWLLAEPEYVSQLQVQGDRLNLVYIAGFDVHREPMPSEVPLKEVTLLPGDVLYFPPMTFHAVYNLDPVTVGVDNAAFDPTGGLVRHWFLTATTILNPWTALKAISILLRTGSFTCTALYFDGFSQKAQAQKLPDG